MKSLIHFKYNETTLMVNILTVIGFGLSYANEEDEKTVTINFRIWKLNMFHTIGIM